MELRFRLVLASPRRRVLARSAEQVVYKNRLNRVQRAASTGRRVEDDDIYHAVYSAVVEHELPPGTRLAEDSLARIFGVSRTRIRKVLLRLAHENLLSLRHNRGASVARPTVKEARDVFATRRIVEAGMMRAFAATLTDRHLQRLRRLIEQERVAARAGDRRASIKLSGEFHLEIARIVGNETLTDILRELLSRTSLVIAAYERPGYTACRHDEHAEIVDRLAAGKTEAAIAHMDQHLRRVEGSLALEPAERPPVDLAAVFRRRAA